MLQSGSLIPFNTMEKGLRNVFSSIRRRHFIHAKSGSNYLDVSSDRMSERFVSSTGNTFIGVRNRLNLTTSCKHNYTQNGLSDYAKSKLASNTNHSGSCSRSNTNDNESWRQEKQFQVHLSGMRRDHNVGPYKKGKLFVAPWKDWSTFIINSIIVGVTLYYISRLTISESLNVKRRRIIRDRLLQEYGLRESDIDEIESAETVENQQK